MKNKKIVWVLLVLITFSFITLFSGIVLIAIYFWSNKPYEFERYTLGKMLSYSSLGAILVLMGIFRLFTRLKLYAS